MQTSRTRIDARLLHTASRRASSLRQQQTSQNSRELQELVRLARTVLEKSPEDLAAIGDENAAMQAGWIEAFNANRARAETEAQFWSAAIAYLMATAPSAVANDD